MKHLLQTLLNLIHWVCLSILNFYGIIWYGKLPKASLYHQVKHTITNLYEDENCQVTSTDDVPQRIKRQIIEDYLLALYDNKEFQTNVATISIPIFNGKEVIGTKSVSNLLIQISDSLTAEKL